MRKFSIIAVLAALVLSFSACNTFKGVGQDISAGGQAIDKAATSVQKKI